MTRKRWVFSCWWKGNEYMWLCLSIHVFICLSVSMSVCLYLCLYVCLSLSVYRCIQCTRVCYCSEVCRKASWETYHRIECNFMDLLHAVWYSSYLLTAQHMAWDNRSLNRTYVALFVITSTGTDGCCCIHPSIHIYLLENLHMVLCRRKLLINQSINDIC